MIPDLSVTQIAYICASILSFLYFLALVFRFKYVYVTKSFCVASLINAIWLVSIIFFNPFSIESKELITDVIYSETANLNIHYLLLMELLHYGAWVVALTRTAQRYCPNCIPRSLRLASYAFAILIPLATLATLNSSFITHYAIRSLMWSGILFSLLNMLILEQLYRSKTHDRLVRICCISLGIVFLFDAFMYSQHLLSRSMIEGLWQIRASVSMVTSILLCIATMTLQSKNYDRASISFSQPAIYYTTSLTIVGCALVILATGGYYVNFTSAHWATIIYATVASIGIISIAVTFTSSMLRRKLNVFINKHLFNYKYDYRNEWLKLIRLLSQPTDYSQSAKKSINACADLFRCDGGAIWQKRGQHFLPSACIGIKEKNMLGEVPVDSDFSRILETGWIFAPKAFEADMSRNNEHIPESLKHIDHCWLIFPFMVEEEVSGFMILTNPHESETPNWEDLDLVKTVSRQIANFLARHEQAELLAQARQFETFNKLSAFVMHDLKNLIAQQSLVVKNAEKHKDNPAFVDDAINTIHNSVERMNILLRKLRQNESEETKVLSVHELLVESVRRCQKRAPNPSLTTVADDLHIKADFDSVVMVFTHLVHNSQDATPVTGFIDIGATRQGEHVLITIEDNGEGMSEEFIRTKLFQPFESTKAGKGMGVGVYQAREYIENLGGEIEVESIINAGTKFTLKIPRAAA